MEGIENKLSGWERKGSNMHKNMDLNQYEDIIHLPRPVSKTHPPMPVADRAAQFAPFAALTGYGDAVKETARLTEAKAELSESEKEELDATMQQIRSHMKEQVKVCFTYFVPDEKKEGGAYRTVTGIVKKIDMYRHAVILEDGTKIPTEDVRNIEFS